MKIIKEDQNNLEFVIYPTRMYLFISIIVFTILCYTLYNPVPIWGGANQTPDIVWQLVTFTALVFLVLGVVSLYAVPLKVNINKQSGTLTYRDFTFFTTTFRKGFRMPWIHTSDTPVKEVALEHLKRVIFTDDIPEITNWSNMFVTDYTHGKFCFILDNSEPINVYVGYFSLNRHRVAFKKIADYLGIPYEEKYEQKELSPLEKHSPSNKFIKILLVFMSILIAIVIALAILVYM